MSIIDKPIVWTNGEFVDHLNPADRGLAYGDGLFETMRYQNAQIPLLNLHLQRLQSGLKTLALPDVTQPLNIIIDRAIADLRLSSSHSEVPFSLKIIVTRGLGGHGYKPSSKPEATIVAQVKALGTDHEEAEHGVSLALCRWRLSMTPLLAGIKHLNRLEYVMAARELETFKNATEGLLTDGNNRVIEALHHNLFIVKQQELLTPSLKMCGVKGVMRKLISEKLAPELKLPVVERDLSIDDLLNADEIFLCNSVRGIWPVKEFRSRQWSQWPITMQLQASVQKIWCDGYATS